MYRLVRKKELGSEENIIERNKTMFELHITCQIDTKVCCMFYLHSQIRELNLRFIS